MGKPQSACGKSIPMQCRIHLHAVSSLCSATAVTDKQRTHGRGYYYSMPPHYSVQATLSSDARAGERAGVTASVKKDGPHVLICSLKEDIGDSCTLDLVLNS